MTKKNEELKIKEKECEINKLITSSFISGKTDETKITELFSIFLEKKYDFSEINLTTLLDRFGKLNKGNSFNQNKEYLEEVVALISDPKYQFDCRAISNIFNALPKLPTPLNKKAYQEAIDHLLKAIITRKLNDFNAQDIANILNALAKLLPSLNKANCQKAIDRLLEAIITQKVYTFSPQSIANIFNALPKLPTPLNKKAYQEAIDHLLKAIITRKLNDFNANDFNANDFNAQDIANILNALAKLLPSLNKANCQKAIDRLLEAIITQKVYTFSPQSIANIFNALPKLPTPLNKKAYQEAIDHLLKAIITRKLNDFNANDFNANDFNAQDIANILNALAKLLPSLNKANCQKAIDRLLEAIITQKVYTFSPQSIANIFNALPKLPTPLNKKAYQEAIDHLLKAIITRKLNDFNANDFNAQDIANILNALAKLLPSLNKANCQKAIDRLLEAIITQKVYTFSPQSIANIFNALPKLPTPLNKKAYQEAIDHLLKAIITRKLNDFNANDFNAQDIANIFNALPKLPILLKKEDCQKAINHLLKAIITRKLNDFNAQDIANIFNALPKLPILLKKEDCQKAINHLLKVIITQEAHTFRVQNIANILNALSKLPILLEKRDCQEAITYLLVEVIRKQQQVATFDLQHITVIALALCLFEFDDPDNSRLYEKNNKLMLKLLEDNEDKFLTSLNVPSATQLIQISLFKPGIIPSKFIEEAKFLIKNLNSKDKDKKDKDENNVTSSNLQILVAKCLFRCFPDIEFREEYFIEFTHVDIADPERKFVMQVNGPTHYHGETLNRTSRFNNNLLEKLDWCVVSIYYRKWDELRSDSEKKQYLMDQALRLQKNSSVIVRSKVRNTDAFYDEAAALQATQPDELTMHKFANVCHNGASPNKGKGKGKEKKELPKELPEQLPKQLPKQQRALFEKFNLAWRQKICKELITGNPKMKKNICSDDINNAFLIFMRVAEDLFKEGKIDKKEEKDVLEKVVTEKLNDATYFKFGIPGRDTILKSLSYKHYFFALCCNGKTRSKAFTYEILKAAFYEEHNLLAKSRSLR